MRYSRLFIAPLVLLVLVVGVRGQEVSQGAQAALTNSDVLQMVKSGLSAELVIAKIKASKTNFETSPALLTELKQNGVTENILVAMVEAGSADTVIVNLSTRQSPWVTD